MSVLSGTTARTLEITSDAMPVVLGRPALQPVRLSGTEGLNKLFAYELLLKTPDGLNIEATGAGEFIPGAAGASSDHLGAGVR